MLEVLAVGLIVAVAVLYTVWSLTPAATRARVARRLAAWGRVPGRSAWLARATGTLEQAAIKRVRKDQGECAGFGLAAAAKQVERIERVHAVGVIGKQPGQSRILCRAGGLRGQGERPRRRRLPRSSSTSRAPVPMRQGRGAPTRWGSAPMGARWRCA